MERTYYLEEKSILKDNEFLIQNYKTRKKWHNIFLLFYELKNCICLSYTPCFVIHVHNNITVTIKQIITCIILHSYLFFFLVGAPKTYSLGRMMVTRSWEEQCMEAGSGYGKWLQKKKQNEQDLLFDNSTGWLQSTITYYTFKNN